MDKTIKKIKKLSVFFSEYEDMSRHTTLKSGGTARFYCEVDNIKSLIKIIKLCKNKLPFHILGQGSNSLFLNYKGVVICTRKLDNCKIKGQTVYCECGVNLFKLNILLKSNCLSGLEFSFGIPASVGGACVMNAGAYGKEFGSFVEKVLVYDKKLHTIKRQSLNFSYRNSSLKQNNNVVLAVWLKLKKSNSLTIEQTMRQIYQKRLESQPNLPSAGSVFKRDGDIIPAKIIDNMGFKGVKINGAMVSDKHAGFIVNTGKASPKDILELINVIKNKVKQKYNIDLQQEIEIIGE